MQKRKSQPTENVEVLKQVVSLRRRGLANLERAQQMLLSAIKEGTVKPGEWVRISPQVWVSVRDLWNGVDCVYRTVRVPRYDLAVGRHPEVRKHAVAE